MRLALVCAIALLLAPALRGEPVRSPPAVVGSAAVRVTGSQGRVAARVVFSASEEPKALRLEVVQGGSVVAVLWCDEQTLQVVVPGRPNAAHQTDPSRESFRALLGVPVCLDELLFALRGGRAALPSCAEEKPIVSRSRDGLVNALTWRDEGATLRFRGLRRGADGWPGRALYERPGAVLSLNFGSLSPRQRGPVPLPESLLADARAVDAAELRRLLGIDRDG